MGTRKHHNSKKGFRKTRSKKQRGGDDNVDLLKAVEKGDIKTVERLLAKEGINVNTTDYDFSTLHLYWWQVEMGTKVL